LLAYGYTLGLALALRPVGLLALAFDFLAVLLAVASPVLAFRLLLWGGLLGRALRVAVLIASAGLCLGVLPPLLEYLYSARMSETLLKEFMWRFGRQKQEPHIAFTGIYLGQFHLHHEQWVTGAASIQLGGEEVMAIEKRLKRFAEDDDIMFEDFARETHSKWVFRRLGGDGIRMYSPELTATFERPPVGFLSWPYIPWLGVYHVGYLWLYEYRGGGPPFVGVIHTGPGSQVILESPKYYVAATDPPIRERHAPWVLAGDGYERLLIPVGFPAPNSSWFQLIGRDAALGVYVARPPFRNWLGRLILDAVSHGLGAWVLGLLSIYFAMRVGDRRC
jgi:hypothetical protein